MCHGAILVVKVLIIRCRFGSSRLVLRFLAHASSSVASVRLARWFTMASKVRVAWADVVDSDSDTQSQPDCGGVVVDIPEIVLDESSDESSDCGATATSAVARSPFDFGRSPSPITPSYSRTSIAPSAPSACIGSAPSLFYWFSTSSSGSAPPPASAPPVPMPASSCCCTSYSVPRRPQFLWGEKSRRHATAGWRNAGGYTCYPGTGRDPRENARKKLQKERKKATTGI